MRSSIPLLLAVLLAACSRKPEEARVARELSHPVVRIIEATSPLFLDSIEITDAGSTPSPKLDAALQGVVEDLYFNECDGDSSETYFRMADLLLFTVKLPGRSGDHYLLIMQRLPESSVTGRLVKWDPREERITGGPAEVRLFAMYDARTGTWERSNLKEQFKITGPELEILDTLGREAIIVRRLWHNGTSNAMERTVIGLEQGKVDTIAFRSTPM